MEPNFSLIIHFFYSNYEAYTKRKHYMPLIV